MPQTSRFLVVFALLCGPTVLNGQTAHAQAGPLAHRKSDVTVRVEDAAGNAVPGARIDVKMTRHGFRFGTQVRDELFTISETDFNRRSTAGRQALMPDLNARFGTNAPRFTPDWQDVQKYRDVVFEQFNYIVPTVGLQWSSLNQAGPAVPDAAIQAAQARGLGVLGASVVWEQDAFPTPTEFRSAARPDARTFHNALVSDRLSSSGVLGRYSPDGAGPSVTDWKLLNEPLHQSYYSDAFVKAGIYKNKVAAMADYFVRADAVRPDANLMVNDYNILNSTSDASAREYRDLVNSLRAAGAPIDRVGVQAHMALASVTRADIKRRLDILAETGLPIEITEFDTRDDPQVTLTADTQRRLFKDVLEVSFEHKAVDGFVMWGFWDPAHWRGNGLLYDEDWNLKAEASPWFDLVRGDWMTDLSDQSLDSNGEWSLGGGVFDGTYEVAVTLNGQTTRFDGLDFNSDGLKRLVVPEPASPLLLCLLTAALGRKLKG